MVSKESENGLTINAHEFMYYEVGFNLNNPYTPTKEEEIKSMLDGGGHATDNELIEEIDNVQISDVVVDKVGFEDAKSALTTLKQILEQRPIDVTPFIQSIQAFQKEIGSWHAQESP